MASSGLSQQGWKTKSAQGGLSVPIGMAAQSRFSWWDPVLPRGGGTAPGSPPLHLLGAALCSQGPALAGVASNSQTRVLTCSEEDGGRLGCPSKKRMGLSEAWIAAPPVLWPSSVAAKGCTKLGQCGRRGRRCEGCAWPRSAWIGRLVHSGALICRYMDVKLGLASSERKGNSRDY